VLLAIIVIRGVYAGSRDCADTSKRLNLEGRFGSSFACFTFSDVDSAPFAPSLERSFDFFLGLHRRTPRLFAPPSLLGLGHIHRLRQENRVVPLSDRISACSPSGVHQGLSAGSTSGGGLRLNGPFDNQQEDMCGAARALS